MVVALHFGSIDKSISGFCRRTGRRTLGAPEHFGKTEVFAGGPFAPHAHGQGQRAKRGEPMEGAPALGAEAARAGGPPGRLEGRKALGLEIATRGAGRLDHGPFQIIDRFEAPVRLR